MTAALDPAIAAGDAIHWQAVFDGQHALVAELADGARMGLVVRAGIALAGRRRAGLDAAGTRYAGAPMLAFASANGRIVVTVERFERFDAGNLDLLFVVDDEARSELLATPPSSALRAMKRLIRSGRVMFFVLRSRNELQNAGYEDFLDSLGIPFLGSCR